MAKKLESSLTAEFMILPSPTLRLACCPPHPAYSTPIKDGTGGGGKAYGLEDIAGVITGTVDHELLLRNEYLVTENRLLRQQFTGRVRLTDAQRKTLAEIGHKLGKRALAEVATLVRAQYYPPPSTAYRCGGDQGVRCRRGRRNLNAYAERWVRSIKEREVSLHG